MMLSVHPSRPGRPTQGGACRCGPSTRARGEPTGAPGRRAVLTAGLLGGGLFLLAGCGVRLEDDAPPVPGLPTRSVDPRAVAVARELSLVRRAGAAAGEAGAAGGTLATHLATIHAEQERVFADRVRELAEHPDGSPRLPDASAEGTAVPAWPASEALGLGEPTGSLTLGAGAAEVPADELPLILAVRVQRAVGAHLAGAALGAAPPPATASPAESGRLLEAARSAHYALDVAAARAPRSAEIAGARAGVARTRRELDVLSGADATPPALGYRLPFPVADAEAARRLAVHALRGLTGAVVAGAGAAVGQEPALATLLAWGAQAEGLAVRLGGGLRAFPGLEIAGAGAGIGAAAGGGLTPAR